MYHSTMRSNVGCCSVSLSLNLNLNINLSLSVAPGASGGPCSNTCCGRSDCGIGSYSSNGSYSSSRNGGCSSNDSVLCVRAAAPGPLRQCAPSRTAFVLLCARASASAAGAGTDHAQDSQTCRRQWRMSPPRTHRQQRIFTLFINTETVVQPEPFIEGLQPHPAVDVLDTRCRATITVTCAP